MVHIKNHLYVGCQKTPQFDSVVPFMHQVILKSIPPNIIIQFKINYEILPKNTVFTWYMFYDIKTPLVGGKVTRGLIEVGGKYMQNNNMKWKILLHPITFP